MRRAICIAVSTALLGSANAGAVSQAAHVVGGTSIQVQSAPWAVYVQFQEAASSYYHCSGSIVDATHVVTAASCLYTPSGVRATTSQMSVLAGASNLYKPTSTDNPQFIQVSTIRMHPGFVNSASSTADDIAILTLASSLDLSGPLAQAVNLPSAGAAYPAGASAQLAGFGRQSLAAAATGGLGLLKETVDAQGHCGDSTPALVTGNNGVVLCASSPTGAVCSGDGGAGLVTTGNGTPTLLGISAGSSCDAGSHGTYTNVAAPEILAFIQGNDSPPAAPRQSNATRPRLSWKAPLQVGATVGCSSTKWPGQVRITYTFLNAVTGRTLVTGQRSSYVVPKSVIGVSIACRVAVANAGGTAVFTSITSTTKIAAAAPRTKRR